METEPLVYLNGAFLPASRAGLKVYDAGIVLGATVTEFTRTFRGVPFRLEEHLARLYRGLKYLRIDPGLTPSDMAAATLRLVEANGALLPPGSELGIIHFVTPGEFRAYVGSAGGAGPEGATVCIHTMPLPLYLWSGLFRIGAHVVTPSIRHVPPQCIDPKMKYRSRLHYYLADLEAREWDPRAVALLLDLDGNLTETGGANFLLAREGTVYSPGPRNILPGISRQVVRELCGELGIPFVERDLQPFDAINSDEAFLSTTPYCLAPVTRVNGLPVGDGKPGPLFHRLLAAWSERVGVDLLRQVLEARPPSG